jgi:hypothetical protein
MEVPVIFPIIGVILTVVWQFYIDSPEKRGILVR